MRRTAGARCVLAALALTLTGLTACTDDQPHTLVAAGEDSEAVGEPIPTTTTSTAVTTSSTPVTTSVVRPDAPAAASAAPAPAQQAPADTRPIVHLPPLEPGVESWGYGGYGGLKSVTSASTTIDLTVYPREQYAGDVTQLTAGVKFVGGVRSFRIDFGDGTVMEAFRYPQWDCQGTTDPKTTGDGKPDHVYARPGRYTVTATVTTFDCAPGPAMPWPADAPFPPPIPPVPANEQTTTVSMTAIARSDLRPVSPPPTPPADCPPEAGGC